MSREHHLNGLTWAAIALSVIGALNWGLVGLFRFNLVARIFGTDSVVTRLLYILVALGGITLLAVIPTLRQAVRPASRASTIGDPTITRP